MISVTEAKKIIGERITSTRTATLPLQKAVGLVLAEDVYAAMDIPGFPQSSMDGYAFSFNEWKQHGHLKISGEMAAGSNEIITLDSQQAVRIFTGAAVPPGADTVAMQEKTTTKNGGLFIDDENLQPGANVRPRGAEIKAGAMALPKESYLSPAAVGFLAGIGVSHATIYQKPCITIIVTGNELQQPGAPLQYGQVYESNSVALTAALLQLHLTDVKISWADDNLQVLKTILTDALQQSDAVLLTGGVSVGDYDFVLQAAAECGVTKWFHKVAQRPGKPLYFGMKEEKPVFGLPGNPSSVLTCFYQYVMPALEQMCKMKNSVKTIQAPLATAYKKTAGLTHFLKGSYNGAAALTLDAQESYRLSSFAKANCLIQINEEVTSCKEGDLVEIHLLPF